MLWLSEVMMQHHEIETFDALLDIIQQKAHGGERFFRIDVKPQYADTPNNWEFRLEAVFTSALDQLQQPGNS